MIKMMKTFLVMILAMSALLGAYPVSADAAVCGDGVCNSDVENQWTCWQDCAEPIRCGDNVCNSNEDSDSCPKDCGGTTTVFFSSTPATCSLKSSSHFFAVGEKIYGGLKGISDTACYPTYSGVAECGSDGK